MKIIHYSTGEPVHLNDEVQIVKKDFLYCRRYLGKVVSIPSYDQPMEREVNDFGVSIKIDKGSELWCDPRDGELDKSIIFIRRDA